MNDLKTHSLPRLHPGNLSLGSPGRKAPLASKARVSKVKVIKGPIWNSQVCLGLKQGAGGSLNAWMVRFKSTFCSSTPVCLLHRLYHLVKILWSNTANLPQPSTLPSQRRAGLPGSLVALVTASDPASWCCFLTPLSQTHLCSHPPFSYVFLLPSGSHFFPRSLVHSFALFSVRDLLQQSLSSQWTAANHKNQSIFLFIWLCRVSAAALGISVCRTWTLSLRGLSCFSSRGILVPRTGSNLRPLLCKVDS